MPLPRSPLLAVLLLTGPIAARAQLAATVPASDPVYAVVEELSASLPVAGLHASQRPWSRREVARLASAFDAALRERESDSLRARPPERVRRLVRELDAAYATDVAELRGERPSPVVRATMRALAFEAIGTDAAARRVPVTNGLGRIDAYTHPLVEPDWGRPVADGGTLDVEGTAELGVGGWFALGVQPRISVLMPRGGSAYQQSDFQRLYARGVLANIALEAGMDEMTWGEAGSRGLLLSANPRPLHALTLSNDTAITLPWLFRLLGPTRARFVIANLGNTQNFPGAQLVTYGLSVSPTPRFEMGAALLDQMGGSGSPRCSVTCRAKDLFPYFFWIVKPGSDSQATNKIAQFDVRYRIPRARGLSVYYELSMDDFDARRVRSMLWQDSGHLLGATFERLDAEGRWALDLQAHHASLRLYEHPQFTSGVTYRRAIIGDPLGPNANAGYATLTYRPSLLEALEVTGGYESRDASTYAVRTTNATGAGWKFVETQALPKETRARLGVALRSALLHDGLAIEPSAAVERVGNDGFVAGRAHTDFLVGITGRLMY